MMAKMKEQVFTFKTDRELAEKLLTMPNRSEFIRRALTAAFDQCCPLCQGAGKLTPDQQKHWRHFLSCHLLEQCEKCDALHFVCQSEEQGCGHR